MLKDAYYAAMAAVARLEQRTQLGTSIWESDAWDVCIVLDSCRLDMLQDALAADVDGIWSVGSVTTEWLANTFHRDYVDASELGFVSATPHSTTVFRDREYLTSARDGWVDFPTPNVPRPNEFAGFHEVWRSHANEYQAVPPDVMLDATVEAANRYDRVVSHWLQPHEPFIAPGEECVGGRATSENVWTALQSGDVRLDRVYPAYVRNLEFALEYVRHFLRSFDGTVLLTSDHGNALGAWGVYGHPWGWPEPSVRRVPWLIVEGDGEADYKHESVLEDSQESVDCAEQLRALGYR